MDLSRSARTAATLRINSNDAFLWRCEKRSKASREITYTSASAAATAHVYWGLPSRNENSRKISAQRMEMDILFSHRQHHPHQPAPDKNSSSQVTGLKNNPPVETNGFRLVPSISSGYRNDAPENRNGPGKRCFARLHFDFRHNPLLDPPRYRRVAENDGLVFGSPTWLNRVPGRLR